MMCVLYQVTRGGYYAWQHRQLSDRAIVDAHLIEQVRQIHQQSRGFYGSPRVVGQLHRAGVAVGRRRVARLMRQAHLQGRSARLYRRSKVGQRAGQWRYLAAVMDRHSRRIVGWSLSVRRDAALTRDALRLSIRNRHPATGLVFHSDRGIEYAAFEFRDQLARRGIVQSMNRPGKMNDNAHMESFFHSMKAEQIHGMSFDSDQQLRRALRSYIAFYNQQRIHSSLRYLPPATFEQQQGHQPCVN